jgi:peroxiredoxin
VDRKVGIAYGACDKPTDKSARRITYVIDALGKIEQVHGKVSAKEHPFTLLSSLS